MTSKTNSYLVFPENAHALTHTHTHTNRHKLTQIPSYQTDRYSTSSHGQTPTQNCVMFCQEPQGVCCSLIPHQCVSSISLKHHKPNTKLISVVTFIAYKNQSLFLQWLCVFMWDECRSMCTSAYTCQSEAITITSATLCRQSGLKLSLVTDTV